ncbi:unnamed protein product [Ectocarpus sp. 12 AP-2014]
MLGLLLLLSCCSWSCSMMSAVERRGFTAVDRELPRWLLSMLSFCCCCCCSLLSAVEWRGPAVDREMLGLLLLSCCCCSCSIYVGTGTGGLHGVGSSIAQVVVDVVVLLLLLLLLGGISIGMEGAVDREMLGLLLVLLSRCSCSCSMMSAMEWGGSTAVDREMPRLSLSMLSFCCCCCCCCSCCWFCMKNVMVEAV